MDERFAFFSRNTVVRGGTIIGGVLGTAALGGAAFVLVKMLGGSIPALVVDPFASTFLAQSLLPFVFSLDRFSALFALFGVLALVLTMFQTPLNIQGRLWFFALVVGAALGATTPFAVVVLLALFTGLLIKDTAPKERVGLLVCAGAMGVSILLLSSGALLADMTLLAQIIPQLAPVTVFVAYSMLFFGACGMFCYTRGVTAIFPLYLLYRMSLFFFLEMSPMALTLFALGGLCIALGYAHKRTLLGASRALLALGSATLPLTVLALGMGDDRAVQYLLFGGLSWVFLGVLLPARGAWSVLIIERFPVVVRFLRGISEGLLPGGWIFSGTLLVGMGLWSLARTGGGLWENVYIGVVFLLMLVVLIIHVHTLRACPPMYVQNKKATGPLFALIFFVLACIFQQILAGMGTAPLTWGTWQYVPVFALGVSALGVWWGALLFKKRPEMFARGVCVQDRVFLCADEVLNRLVGNAQRAYRVLVSAHVVTKNTGAAYMTRIFAASPRTMVMIFVACMVVLFLIMLRVPPADTLTF